MALYMTIDDVSLLSAVLFFFAADVVASERALRFKLGITYRWSMVQQ